MKIEINRISQPKVLFRHLAIGDIFFTHDVTIGMACMKRAEFKIPGHTDFYNAVRLSTGQLDYYADTVEVVIPREAVLKITV